MARICCPKGHYHDVAGEPGNGTTVEVRSVADAIQLCPVDGCSWFMLRDGVPSWPEHPIAVGMPDNVTHLVAAAARRLLRREYPRESDRKNAVQNDLSSLIHGWKPELRELFPGVDWDRLNLDHVIAEVKADEGPGPVSST